VYPESQRQGERIPRTEINVLGEEGSWEEKLVIDIQLREEGLCQLVVEVALDAVVDVVSVREI
jgi:hypothetical protein